MLNLQNAIQLSLYMNNDSISDSRTLLIHNAKSKLLTIAFADALDIRVMQAALSLKQEQYANPVLIGNRQDIVNFANNHSIDISSIEIRDPEVLITQEYVDALMSAIPSLNSAEETRLLLVNPLYFAGIEAKLGHIHGSIAGNISTTGEVIRAGIKSVGLAEGIQTVSSFFAMIFPDQILFYADCAVVPSPSVEQLCDIAAITAENFKKINNMDPRVAFLSFSTKGSSTHEDAKKVRDAFELFTLKHPTILADGELQFDAAFVPEIAGLKAPKSPLEGRANVLIFPDLDAGNIAYKITQRMGGARAIGPIVQGLSRPYVDLSRGCSTEDIIDVALICAAL